MKNFKKLIAILVYLFIMSYLLDFKLAQLFDLKQLFLVLTGMFILFLPGYRRGESMRPYAKQLARCAIFASYIQTFILLFNVLSTPITLEELPKEAALGCRPLLYGICLWVILSAESGEKNPTKPDSLQAYNNNPPDTDSAKASHDNHHKPEPSKEIRTLTASEAYESYRKLGLTNREAEIAIQICKGLSNAEIAAELCISETTVKKHISNIFDKLGINRREQILKDFTPFA